MTELFDIVKKFKYCKLTICRERVSYCLDVKNLRTPEDLKVKYSTVSQMCDNHHTRPI